MKLILSFPEQPENQFDFPELKHNYQLAFWIHDTHGHDRFCDLVNKFGKPNIVISSAHPEYPYLEKDIKYYYVPDWLAWHVSQFDLESNNNLPIEKCFNFFINKKQLNRILLLKLVEWFDLDSYFYTWSGIGQTFDGSEIVTNLHSVESLVDLKKFQHHMLYPIQKIK